MRTGAIPGRPHTGGEVQLQEERASARRRKGIFTGRRVCKGLTSPEQTACWNGVNSTFGWPWSSSSEVISASSSPASSSLPNGWFPL